MLFGLELLDRCGIYADNVHDVLVIINPSFKMQITRKFGHMYIEWQQKSIFITRKELEKFH